MRLANQQPVYWLIGLRPKNQEEKPIYLDHDLSIAVPRSVTLRQTVRLPCTRLVDIRDRLMNMDLGHEQPTRLRT